jgi:hypothetical protein
MKPSTNEASDPAFRVDNLLCFAVYAASRAITKAYRPLLEPLGLTYPQYLVLLVLWEKGGCTVKDLSLTTKGLAFRQKVASVPKRISCSMGLSAESQRQLQQELRVLTENVSNNIPE